MRSLQAAFRALCLGLILPLAMFVASELLTTHPVAVSPAPQTSRGRVENETPSSPAGSSEEKPPATAPPRSIATESRPAASTPARTDSPAAEPQPPALEPLNVELTDIPRPAQEFAPPGSVGEPETDPAPAPYLPKSAPVAAQSSASAKSNLRPVPEPVAQEQRPVAAVALKNDGPCRIEIADDLSTGRRFNLSLHEAPLSDVLHRLAQLARQSIVVGQGVRGGVTAELREVSLDAALNAVLKPGDYVHTTDGTTIYVSTRSEAIVRDRRDRQVSTRIYLPQHLGIGDLRSLIEPLLTPQLGRVGMTTRAVVTPSGNIPRQALLVQDVDEVLADIDAIVDELDVAPREVSLEAVVLRLRLHDSAPDGVSFSRLQASSPGVTLRDLPPPPPSHAGALGRPLVLPPGSVRYGVLSQDPGAFIGALKGFGEPAVITTPNLMILDRQTADLNVGRRVQGSTSTPVLQVRVRPLIGTEGRIRLDVVPILNQVMGLSSQATLKDGQTLVLGGLLESTLEQTQSAPPLGISWLPSRTSTRTVRAEWVLLLTPRLKEPPASQPPVSADLFSQGQNFGLGKVVPASGIDTRRERQGVIRRVRSGLTPWPQRSEVVPGELLTRPTPPLKPTPKPMRGRAWFRTPWLQPLS